MLILVISKLESPAETHKSLSYRKDIPIFYSVALSKDGFLLHI